MATAHRGHGPYESCSKCGGGVGQCQYDANGRRKPRINWENFHTLSILKAAEGGIGQRYAMELLREAHVPCRPGTSIYVGQTGVEVPQIYFKRAVRVLWGSR